MCPDGPGARGHSHAALLANLTYSTTPSPAGCDLPVAALLTAIIFAQYQ
jgi:hypothetical protein